MLPYELVVEENLSVIERLKTESELLIGKIEKRKAD